MRNLGVGLLLGTILALSGCTLWSEHTVQHWQDATGGEGLERSFWNEVQSKNWTELERHLGGNYMYTGPEGRLDRQAALDRLRQFDLKEFSMGDMQVELNTETLVVTYTLTLRGTRAGQPLRGTPVRLLAIWQRQKAGWMALAHSVVSTQPD